jgi:hypothetical protein
MKIKSVYLTVRITEAEKATIAHIASQEDRTISQVGRRLILAGLKARKP